MGTQGVASFFRSRKTAPGEHAVRSATVVAQANVTGPSPMLTTAIRQPKEPAAFVGLSPEPTTAIVATLNVDPALTNIEHRLCIINYSSQTGMNIAKGDVLDTCHRTMAPYPIM